MKQLIRVNGTATLERTPDTVRARLTLGQVQGIDYGTLQDEPILRPFSLQRSMKLEAADLSAAIEPEDLSFTETVTVSWSFS